MNASEKQGIETSSEGDQTIEENKLVTSLENTEVTAEGEDSADDGKKYSPEAISEDVRVKAEKIRNWAQRVGLSEGKDFQIVENIADVATDAESIAPHEMKQFFVVVQEDSYRKFKEYILGEYSAERKAENPDNKYGGPKLDYSWGGRFLVGWDGVPFDTVAATTIDNPSVPTHNEEFKAFFKQKTGFDFPTSETLNPILSDMSEKGLSTYKNALERLKTLRDNKTLPGDGYGLIDAMEHIIMILEDARNGEAVSDLPETIQGEMPAKMRHYADLTYNAEDIKNLDRVTEITDVALPDELRIDKIFARYGFDRQRMEDICRDFSEYIALKKEIGVKEN